MDAELPTPGTSAPTAPATRFPPVAAAPRVTPGVLFVALCVLVIAGNVLRLPLFVGVDFLFGSVAALLAARWLGALPGMAVAGIGALATAWLWDHPYAMLIFMVEAGVVGLLLRRRSAAHEPPPLALADGLFWLVLGIPLSLLLLHGLLQMPWPHSGGVALALATNGLLNAALAGVVVIVTKRLRHPPVSVSLREFLFSTLLPAVLVPAVTLAAVQHGAAGRQSEVAPRAAPGGQAVQGTLGTELLLLALISLAAVLGTDYLSRRSASPLRRLAQRTADPALVRGLAGPLTPPPPGLLRETNDLAAAIHTMLESLAGQRRALELEAAANLAADARHDASERGRFAAERDAAAGALRRYNTDLEGFSDLMAGYRPPHEQIRALLDFACRSLGANAAALGEIQGASYRLLTSFGAAGPGQGPVLAPGVLLALGPADQAGIQALERLDETPPSARTCVPQPCALPPQSRFAAAALLRWSDAEGRAHLGVLSFAPGQELVAAATEKLQVIQLVGQGIASSLRERAVLDGLLAARQREIIGHLASGVAHDFNNLLGVVDINLDYLAALLRTRGLPTEVAEVLKETRLAARHAQMVTTGLLSLSRGRRLATGPTPVSAVAERFTRTLARILPPQIEVKTHITPGLIALADEALLQATLLNLCINARDAMGGRGTLEISVARTTRTTALPLTLGRLDPGDYVELAVADTGVGMSAEVLGRIFEPLFSTKSSGRGTGLGLFMVREFVDRCGGGVGVETRPGRGSRFTVHLPVAAALPPPESGTAAAAAAPLPPLSARVLLVDDDPGIRAVLCRTLERHGLQVDQAVDGAEALARVEGGAPCDLVLSDIVMPRMDGIELHRRLAQAAPGLPVILMTADEHQSVQAAGLPVDTVILFKPLVAEILLSRIQERLPRRG